MDLCRHFQQKGLLPSFTAAPNPFTERRHHLSPTLSPWNFLSIPSSIRRQVGWGEKSSKKSWRRRCVLKYVVFVCLAGGKLYMEHFYRTNVKHAFSWRIQEKIWKQNIASAIEKIFQNMSLSSFKTQVLYLYVKAKIKQIIFAAISTFMRWPFCIPPLRPSCPSTA